VCLGASSIIDWVGQRHVSLSHNCQVAGSKKTPDCAEPGVPASWLGVVVASIDRTRRHGRIAVCTGIGGSRTAGRPGLSGTPCWNEQRTSPTPPDNTAPDNGGRSRGVARGQPNEPLLGISSRQFVSRAVSKLPLNPCVSVLSRGLLDTHGISIHRAANRSFSENGCARRDLKLRR
jgi:hypothetical protein